MPSIIDYSCVLQRLESDGLKCHYYNGGSFGFEANATTEISAWIGPADETIKAEVKDAVRGVPPPYEENLARAAVRAWRELLPGNVWVMPASHWSFELEHGNREWLPGVLQKVGVDPGQLTGRTNAAAIEFLPGEELLFEQLLMGLLHALRGSDFTIAFPGRAVVATIHHHKQLWWVTTDSQFAVRLDELAR